MIRFKEINNIKVTLLFFWDELSKVNRLKLII